MQMWFNESDICWCADSDRCKNTECFRHWDNKPVDEYVFTCSRLMGTELCQLAQEGED